jgi:hypothetical protein
MYVSNHAPTEAPKVNAQQEAGMQGPQHCGGHGRRYVLWPWKPFVFQRSDDANGNPEPSGVFFVHRSGRAIYERDSLSRSASRFARSMFTK